MKRNLCLLLLLMLFWILPVFAQDSTPIPTEEPAPVDTTTITTTTTTPESPGVNIGELLTWTLAFIALWQAAGIAYALTIEKTIKPVLYSIVHQFTPDKTVRNGLLMVMVFVGAFYAVQTGGINLFADAPFAFLQTAPPSFLLVLNSLFVATGAFMGHEIWDALSTWLKKLQAVDAIVES